MNRPIANIYTRLRNEWHGMFQLKAWSSVAAGLANSGIFFINNFSLLVYEYI